MKKKRRSRPERLPLPNPQLEQMVRDVEGSPCAGCGREDYLPSSLGIWQTGSKRTIPYLLCRKCHARVGDQELAIEIEKRVGGWISGSPN